MTPRRPAGRAQRRGDAWWPPPSTPIAVEGGLQARSRRGRIGDTWWSQRFIAVLESFGIGSRLQRGKRYARTGQVLAMEISPGQVRASVQGSRTKPYRVFIETGVLTGPEWDAVEAVMASRAVFVAKLLAGEMPEEIEEAFTASSATLFPASVDELDSACSCPDWENPCKHIAAVFYLLAEAFDGDPFLIFAWRGRTEEDLLAGLRARRRRSGPADGPDGIEGTGSARGADGADGAGVAGVTDGAGVAGVVPDPTSFGWPSTESEPVGPRLQADPMAVWGGDADLGAFDIRPRLAVAPDLVLRQLDPAPLAAHGARIAEGLAPIYEAMTSAALALGDPSPEPGGQPSPGSRR